MVMGLLKKFRGASLGLLMAVMAGCGGGGISIKGDYPELTPELKMQLEEKILSLMEGGAHIVERVGPDGLDYRDLEAVPFEGAPKELLNYFIDFTQEDYRVEGIEMPGLQGMTLFLRPSDEVDVLCNGGGNVAGCNASGRVILEDALNIMDFFSLFSHEFGHQIYPGNMEYPSKANEKYSPIKLYEFSRRIGSLLIQYSFDDWGSRPFGDKAPFFRMYPKGNLFGLINLNDNMGKIEQAMDYVAHARLLAIEARLDKKIPEYGTDNPAEMCFKEWNDLLGSVSFIHNLSEKHLTFTEAKELVGYMRLLNYRMSGHGFEGNKVAEEYYGLLESFKWIGYSVNPYFKGNVVAWLTEKNYSVIKELVAAGDFASGEIYDSARDIIRVNGDYPCSVEDPYECPIAVRGIRPSHAFAYYVANYAAYNGDDNVKKVESLDDAIDFIVRFYPDVNFFTGDFTALEESTQVQTNNYVPPIAVNAGIYALGYNPDLAGRLFNAAVAVDCLGYPMVYTADKSCWEMQQVAQSYLDEINAR